MYLSKLKIFGFKSFARKVEINFPGNGLTSVVGPNGCGKSNIVDAIRWVMGEQRAKQLRSSNMADVIFSGTKDSPPLNMAEVSLIINNDKGMLPSEYSEIQITRRAFRDGSSEYLINNQDCRLKDIQNLFYDTGMGASSYSLMEQRMIDAILQRPEDRRAVLEEAAGISKYKQQRKEALRQLERTEADLERVEENLRSTRRTLRMYEKQVEKAREFQKLQKNLRELEVSLSYDKYAEFKESFFKLEEQWNMANESKDTLGARLAELEAIIEERKLAMSEEEEAFRELDRQVVDKNMSINDLNNKVHRHGDRMKHIEVQLEQWQEEMEDARAEISQLKERKAELEEELGPLQEQLNTADDRLEMMAEQRNVVRERFEEARNKTRDLDSKRTQLLNEYMKLRDELAKGNQRLMLLEDRRQSLEAEIAELQPQLNNVQEQVDSQDEEGNTELGETLQEQIQVEQSRFEEIKEQIQNLERQEREAEGKRIALNSRKEVLERMMASGDGAGAGAKLLMENHGGKIQGLLADAIKVDEKYLEMVECAMGASMQTLLLQDATSSNELLNFLDDQKKGNVLLGLPDFPRAEVEKPSISHGDFLGWASDFVEVSDQYAGLVLGMLDRYALVSSYEASVELAKEYAGSGFHFIGPKKRVVSSTGMVRGGSGQSGASGILNRSAELEKITAEMEEFSRTINDVQDQKLELQEGLEVAESRKLDLQEQFQTWKEEAQQKESARRYLINQLKDLENRMNQRTNTMSQIVAEIEKLRGELGEGDEERLLAAEEAKDQAEADYQESSELSQELQGQVDSQNEDYMEAERQLSGDRQRQVQIVQMLENAASAMENQENLISNRQSQMEKVVEEKEDAQDEFGGLGDLIEQQYEVLTELTERRDEAKAIFDEKMGQLEGYREEISEINRQIRDSGDSSHQIEMKMQAQQSNAKNIKERMFEQYEVNLDEKESLELIEYDLGTIDKDIRELKSSIKKLGSINMDAFENYEEEKAQLDEVERQYDDLDRARISLERTIRRLDKIARERFADTFEKIKDNFKEVFAGVTNGGEARIHLDGDDPLEAKVMVNAAQPGRTLKGIDLLSGGEKAMTAVSLLFSLYMVKPSPYSILDEVDAPLDDANVQRFVKLLRRFSRATQFIIVTHNKHTMAASDRLYGVTQETKGISEISAVQLDEAAGLVD